MATTSYQRNDLRDAIADTTIQANLSSQVNIQNILNRTARMVFAEIDLRSAKRIAVISPNVFDNVYLYTAPADLKDYALVDIRPQVSRQLDSRVKLVIPEQFDRKKSDRNLMVSVLDDDFVRKLMIDIDVDETKKQAAGMDSINSGGGTWIVFGDGTNVVLDKVNRVEGSGSLKFDLVGSGTTAGLENSSLTSFNISDYTNDGYALAWIYINSITNLTNFIIRIGSSSGNYHQITVTADSAGNAFVNGWNLIRWNFADKSDTGTPDDTAVDYCTVYMTKTSGKSDDGYRIDDVQLHTGDIYEVEYYTKYPWQNTSGTYLENSTSGTDYVNADTDEFDLLVFRGKVELARELRDWEQYNAALAEYREMTKKYKLSHPSQRLLFETEYN